MIKILLADDHTIVRAGLRAILEREGRFEVVGEAEDGLQAVEYCIELKPDILLLDIGMPKMNGLEVTKEIAGKLKLDVAIVILSMYSDPAVVRQAIKNGARGYLVKRSVTEELILAVDAAVRNETYLSPGITSTVINAIREQDLEEEDFDLYKVLTARERQILQMIAEGRTNREISYMLGLSERTVEKHRANTMKKLNVSDIASLIKIAIKYKIINIEE